MPDHPTVEEVCNLALGKIGQYSLRSINEDNHIARLCRLHLPVVRRELLRRHSWNFATRFAELVANPTELDVKWAFRYDLPDDYIQLIKAWHDADMIHRIDGFNVAANQFLISEEHAFIEYTADVCNPTLWDEGFLACVTTYLAGKLAPAIAGSTRMGAEQLQELWNITFPEAIQQNAVEDHSRENNPTNERLRESAFIQQNQTIL